MPQVAEVTSIIASPHKLSLDCFFVHDNIPYATVPSNKELLSKVAINSTVFGLYSHQATLYARVEAHDLTPAVSVYCKELGEVFWFYPKKQQFRVFKLSTIHLRTLSSPQAPELSVDADTCFDSNTGKIVVLSQSTYSLFDVKTSAWETIEKQMPTVEGSRLFAVGRPNSSTIDLFYVNAHSTGGILVRYDIKQDTWTTVSVKTTSPHPRKKATFCVEPNEAYAVLYGGQYEEVAFGDLWLFHFASLQWHRILIEGLSLTLKAPKMAFFRDGVVGIFGLHGNKLQGMQMMLKDVTRRGTISAPIQSLSLYESQQLADVTVLVPDGTATAHHFVLLKYPSILKFLHTSETTAATTASSATATALQLDLRPLNIQKNLLLVLLKMLYAPNAYTPSHEDTDEILDLTEITEQLGLTELHAFLSQQLDSLLNTKYPANVTCLIRISLHRTALKHSERISNSVKTLNSTELRTLNKEVTLKANPQVLFLIIESMTQEKVVPTLISPSPPIPMFNEGYDVYLTDRAKSIQVGAHKAYLCQCSDYFKVLFSGQFRESNKQEGADEHEITLDCDASALKMVVGLLYEGSIGFTVSPQVVDDLMNCWVLSDHLMLTPIREKIANFLAQAITGNRLLDFIRLTKNTNAIAAASNSFSAGELLLMDKLEK